MSWQEKIERYKAKREAEQAEEAKRGREAKLDILREKIPPLLEALDKLNCVELLTQIKDEVWKLGEIEVKPDLAHLTPSTPIEASVSLIARWPYYRDGYTQTDWAIDHVIPPEIEIHIESLAIEAKYGVDGKILIKACSSANEEISSSSFPADSPEAESKLEELLAKDIMLRQEVEEYYTGPRRRLPYDQRKKGAETRVIRAVVDGLEAPRGCEYLLELAEKARFEQPKPPIASKPGFLEKLFGKQ